MIRKNPVFININESATIALVVAIAFAGVILPAIARAQDAHYWSTQNGAQATLLGGAVVALDPDLSASYYNPGSLARGAEGHALSMFAKTVTDLTLTLGTNVPLTGKSSVGASAPGMFAARIPGVHIVQDDVITFSYLVHQSTKLDLSGATLSSPTIPAEALDYYIFQDIYDGWYGLSWARDVDGFGVGMSLFFSSVSYRQRVETRDILLSSASVAAAYSENLYYNFACRRLIAKGGVSWTGGPVSLGATVTLPSLELPWSHGTLSAGRNLVAIDSTLSAGEIAVSRQEGLSVDYREPVSIALGAQVGVGSFDFYASAEWFGPISEYDVMETTPIASQVPPAEFPLPITQSRDAVFNVAGGVSVKATSWLSLFGSVRTDRSYRDPSDRTFVGLGAYDLTHLTGGVSMSTKQLEVALGVLYASGNSEGQIGTSPLPGAPVVPTTTDFTQRGFVLAFSATF